MSAGYTPGPWCVSTSSLSTVKAFNAFGDSGMLVASALGDDNSGFFPSHDERDANARLIAAAPELLAVLEKIMQRSNEEPYLFKDSGEMRTARAAIKKATGENNAG